MRKAALLAMIALLLSGLAVAQAEYPGQTPAPTQSSPPPSPQNPTNPSSQMPPDKPAPPPTPKAEQPATTAPQTQNEPVLGSRPPAPPYQGGQIAAGTELHATLDTALSTKTSHVGDQFTATLSDPVRDSHGAIALPVGTKIHGEVAQAEQGKTLPSVRGEGKLNLRFRDITLPAGTTEALAAQLMSVHETKGGTPANTGQEGDVSGGTSGKSAAKDVGIGAGAGTVAGLLFGHALRGLAIGAAAGGGYVLATSGKEVSLPAETGLLLKLDQPLSVPAAAR